MASETRQEARARITAELMAAARRQLAEVGAAGLSLREVAREIGMVSSAVYRYVENRDELLTRLIIEAYDSLGAVAEQASAAAPSADLERWVATAHAIRRWSLDHPHEHLLLYGSPVPGYAAPEDTIGPATRSTFALLAIVVDAAAAGRLEPPTGPPCDVAPAFADELVALADTLGPTLDRELPPDPEVVLAVLTAWTQMFGLIGFELTNQTRNVVQDHDALFDATVRRLAHHIGLR